MPFIQVNSFNSDIDMGNYLHCPFTSGWYLLQRGNIFGSVVNLEILEWKWDNWLEHVLTFNCLRLHILMIDTYYLKCVIYLHVHNACQRNCNITDMNWTMEMQPMLVWLQDKNKCTYGAIRKNAQVGLWKWESICQWVYRNENVYAQVGLCKRKSNHQWVHKLPCSAIGKA